VVVGGILLRAYKRRSWVGVATQVGKDYMHTAPFGCTAHLACLNLHMARVCSCRSSRILAERRTRRPRCARVDRRIPAQTKDCNALHGCETCANTRLAMHPRR
jgi:hypothetical protein